MSICLAKYGPSVSNHCVDQRNVPAVSALLYSLVQSRFHRVDIIYTDVVPM